MTRALQREPMRHSVRAVLAGLLSIGLLVTGGCATAAVVGQSSPAAPVSELVLPGPTGEHPVGTRSLHLVDEDRPDPWKPKTGSRELMTSLWYPASSAGGEFAEYMSRRVSREYAKLYPDSVRMPPDALSTVRTNATTNARPMPGHWPLVVLSPGFGNPRAMVTGLAEELASQGYIVLAVDHNYEAPIEFPDGRVTRCAKPVPCAPETLADLQKVVESRAMDLSFALDELIGPTASWSGARFVDSSRIGVAGHSIGGATAAELARTDDRVDAGVNMDGTFYAPNSIVGLDSPFLLLGNGIRHEKPKFDPSWSKAWPGLTGWKRGLLVKETGHSSFTDGPGFVDQLGVRDQYPPKQAKSVLGSIPSWRAMTITRHYVLSMFELHLKDRPQSLLDRPSPNYPEVVFWKGGPH